MLSSALGANALAVSAFVATNTASAAAMIAWLVMDAARGGRPTAMGACIGAVVGLVAITPAAGYVTVGASIAIGVIASIISNLLVVWKNKTLLDDTLDVFPCHGAGGMTGMLLTAVYASTAVNPGGADGLLYGDPTLLIKHTVALIAVAIYSLGASYALYAIVDRLTPLRVHPDQEAEGLDLSQHGERVFEGSGESMAAK